MIKISTKPRQEKKSDPYYQTKGWKSLRMKVFERDKGLCQECLRQGIIHSPIKYGTADHIIPRKQGGTDTLDNLEWLCKKHHDIKRQQESLK